MDVQPKWKTPEYTKRQINIAGDVIRDDLITEPERKQALDVIDNWRASHAYPMHVFYMHLRRLAADRPYTLVAERLKRLDSIVNKLDREEGMQLYRMQDIGGCRIVVPTIGDVYELSGKIKNSQIRHELKKENDYIQAPKTSGYRSLHLIYKFVTKTPGKEIYNQYPMLIELQFRTHLQHIWATALETIGAFTNQALKAGQGSEEILRFFVVVSSLFAIKEGVAVAPGTSDDEKDLVSEIKTINENLHILDMLQAIRVAMIHQTEDSHNQKGYYILELNYVEKNVQEYYFKPSELAWANKMYDYLENQSAGKPVDIVLVRATSYGAVRASYPNYFLDIEEFVSLIKKYLE